MSVSVNFVSKFAIQQNACMDLDPDSVYMDHLYRDRRGGAYVLDFRN